MSASSEAEGQLRGLDMTLPLRLWLLLLLTAGLPGRGADEAVLRDIVTVTVWSSASRESEDSSLGVMQPGDAIHNTTFGSTEAPTETFDGKADSPVLMVIIPLILLLLIVLVIALFALYRRYKRKTSSFNGGKEDEFLPGSDAEKVPMPMFEDDVPSVMELEMEDLEKWMEKDCKLSK
ncbi:transmembrane protein 154 isoform X1 [Arapaima gigas]